MNEFVAPLLFFFVPIAISLVFTLILSVFSRIQERNHLEDLQRREALVGDFALSDLRDDPYGRTATAGQLVSGSVVMGTGRLRQFQASIRTTFGGEIKGYQGVLDRARREAQLRMIEAAKQHGAQGVINVRFETTDVGGQSAASEILVYGTMVKA